MIVRPELQALRSNDAPQRTAQAAIRDVYEGWRHNGLGRQAEAELVQFGRGAEIDDLPLLATLFASGEDRAALRFVASLVDPLLQAMARQPLSQAPLRYSSDQSATSLSLVRKGTTTLTLQVINGTGQDRKPDPVSARFVPAETFERVLAGTGSVRRVSMLAQWPDGADLQVRDVALAPGDVSHRMGQSEVQLVSRVPATLALLKLQRRVCEGTVTREYALADGRLVHQSASSPRESRLELTAALLGRMGRSDAAPLLAALAEEDGSESLRWQSLRECLALDTAAGFATLCRIAQRSDDRLAVPAGALRAQLLETYPQLAGASQCPA